MLKIKRILRDYGAAGSVNSLVGLWGFVDDETFITKAGHVGVVYRLSGVDYECLDHAPRRDIVHRYEAALRSLDESCRVYQYLIKRRVAPITPAPCAQQVAHEAVQRRAAYLNSRRDELYEFDLHLVESNGLAFRHVDAFDSCCIRSCNVGFHFHGFQNNDRLTGFNFIPFFNQEFKNESRHGGMQ